MIYSVLTSKTTTGLDIFLLYWRFNGGIYELISVDDAMRTMIHDGVSEQELERHARLGSPSIRTDGRRQVLLGHTTLDEVLRVTRED